MRNFLILVSVFSLLAACGTTDSTMRSQGHSDAYVVGFHDGRHSGLQEAGNEWEHYIRDYERFESDAEYKSGWLAGEAEGKRLQAQATAVGEAAAGTYSGYQIDKEVKKSSPHPEKEARKVLKGVDTDELKSLEK